MNQNERRRWLLHALLEEMPQYQYPVFPYTAERQWRLLRSLMNVRPPMPAGEEFLKVQDAFLREMTAEKGVTDGDSLPACKGDERLVLWQGDITTLRCDAIVNAANSEMLGCFVPMHTCIDNCIHTYAGVQLRLACAGQMQALRRVHGADYTQPTAVPMLTDGYNLPAKKVVHIVGPIVDDRLTPELEAQLAACYRNTLDLCAEKGLKTVAFCGISTGVFRFPADRAAEIAVQTVSDWLTAHPAQLERVIFDVHSEQTRKRYEALLA